MLTDPLLFAQLLVFHPVDTVAKRLMSNKVSGAAVSAAERIQEPPG